MVRGLLPSSLTPGRARRPAPGSTILPVPAAPATPSTPSPADAATALYTLLSWLSAGQARADIYLGTVTPPVTLVVPKFVGFSYVPTLLPSTTYYWQIVAFNDGGSATGPIWSFTTPAATKVIVLLAGVDVTSRVRWGSCTIHDALNAAPNTADLTFDTAAPTEGEALKIGLSSLDDADLLFAGSIQDVGDEYVDHPDSALWPVTLVDYTFTLNKRRPFGTWVTVSATTIAQYLVSTYAPGFSAAGVQAGLVPVSIVFDGSADFMTCLGRLATAIGGQCDVSYARVVSLCLSDASDPPDPLDAAHPPLNDPPIRFATDLSQIRTKVYGKGHAETVPCDVAVGETIVPLADAVMFGTVTAGGSAIAGTTAGGAQSDVLTYSGVQLGGVGSLVGPGVAPSVKPTVTPWSGAGMEEGVHQWAYTWKTAAGESLPAPLATKTMETLPAAPPIDSIDTAVIVGGPNAGTTMSYVIAIIRDIVVLNTSGFPSGISDPLLITTQVAAGNTRYTPRFTATANTFGRYVGLFRSDAGGGGSANYYLLGYILCGVAPGLSTVIVDDEFFHNFNTGYSSTFISFAAWTGFTSIHRAALAAIAIGPTGTTQRKIYRTAAGASQLQLQQTIANNTATVGVMDATADAALGANAPTSDTSGLTQPTGQVNAGSTSLLTAGAAPFPADGGWTLVGSQVIRYTGVTDNTLTGIPASGPGAITTTIPYNSAAIAVPALTGVNANNGLARAMAKGSTVAIWVERNDLAAQIALGFLELDADGHPTDGIHEYTITNGSRGEASLIEECDADLAIFSRPIVSASYDTRDPKTKSGKTVTIDLTNGFFDAAFFDPTFFGAGAYGLSGDFLIQAVDITFDGPLLYPRYSVTASSVAFTLMDLLRRVQIRI